MSTAVLSKIAMLNDYLRASFQGGKVVTTAAVAELPSEVRAKVLDVTRKFNDFTRDNDPYGEHDCAFFQVDGERYFFKIDCYDKMMEYGSENPEDPKVTTRVLTIGTAADY